MNFIDIALLYKESLTTLRTSEIMTSYLLALFDILCIEILTISLMYTILKDSPRTVTISIGFCQSLDSNKAA